MRCSKVRFGTADGAGLSPKKILRGLPAAGKNASNFDLRQ
jgi:hypothetical protein